MIETIKVSANFDTPIKSWSLRRQFSPPPGITAVIGRNGSGKSLLAIEAPRYLLFGKKALRGAAGDYKEFEAEGIFVLGGRRVSIERRPHRERLTDLATGVVEAVGAEAVTKKVVELLGYGLDVFDLANAAVQKQTDKLGQLRPAQRKELIDRVVGLADYETIAKACRDEASKLKSEADGMTRALRAPIAPVQPEGYSRADDIQVVLTRQRELRAEYDKLENATLQLVAAPSAVEGPRITEAQVDEAVQVQARADAEKRERERLQAIVNAMPPSVMEDEEIAAAEARYEWEQLRDARGPKPTMPREDVEAMLAVWDEIDLRKRMSDEQATCPSCGTEFRVGGEVPEAPALTRGQLNDEMRAHGAWATPLPEAPTDKYGSLDAGGARHARKLRDAYLAGLDAQEALQALPTASTEVFDLAGLRARLKDWQRHDAQVEAFQAAQDRAQRAREALEQWVGRHGKAPTDEQLDELQKRLTESRLYEAAQVRFKKDEKEFEANTAAIAELTRRAEEYREGSASLTQARATFKAHLAPLLSRIASSLIYDMSAGELTSVTVDEDMEITVDGQRIETLSGAGETVANLALRIALGQALVADSFPVFFGDEIDSDADEQRRAATKQALQALKTRLKQIILVTHRAVDVADLVVDMDNPQE